MALGFSWTGIRSATRNNPRVASSKKAFPIKKGQRSKNFQCPSSLSYSRACSWSRNDSDRFTDATSDSGTCVVFLWFGNRHTITALCASSWHTASKSRLTCSYRDNRSTQRSFLWWSSFSSPNTDLDTWSKYHYRRYSSHRSHIVLDCRFVAASALSA